MRFRLTPEVRNFSADNNRKCRYYSASKERMYVLLEELQTQSGGASSSRNNNNDAAVLAVIYDTLRAREDWWTERYPPPTLLETLRHLVPTKILDSWNGLGFYRYGILVGGLAVVASVGLASRRGGTTRTSRS